MSEDISQAIETLKKSQKMLGPVLASFEERVARFGADPRSAFWKNEEWQIRRYDILSRLFAPEDRQGGISITDFGCGYGAFFDYLKDRPVMNESRYIGIDISQAMIDEAENCTQDPRAKFHRHLIATEEADYTFVCGTYNMNLSADEGEWLEYVKASLEQLWSKTRKALGFNLLRADAPDQYPGLYYADGKAFEDFCREKLSPDVTYTDDRPLPDWTIFVRR
ncbi:MAG: methyltransferase domain-containing protein [Rhodospirillales bacterium]|nr:methyltransferase domain-containing protein [Rhodospirillales bacterium]